MVTFDESETYGVQNRVGAVLLGGAIPASLHGTVDPTFYTHYSTISTVSSNWKLPSLGRWDCGANIFELVANRTGYENAEVDVPNLYLNESYPGIMSDARYTPGFWPAPNTVARCSAGYGALPDILSTWGKSAGSYNYTNVFPYNGPAGVNVGAATVVDANDITSTSTSGGNSTSAASGSPASKTNAAAVAQPDVMALLGAAALAAALL